MSDSEALLARLRAGDPAAFDAIYERYRPRLYSFLARLSGEAALAEDLLQETFMRLARHAVSLAPDSRIDAWLFTVARNLFLSHRRWALLDIARVSELRLWAQLEPNRPTPFAQAAANETEQLIEQAIADLPLAYRETILLVAVEGMSPTEAAAVMGLKPAAVRQRLARARAMIQARLDRPGTVPSTPGGERAGSDRDEH
ncbi:MAG: RNA polymerase sigma factor [Deltaproteobacteria bacterium]|nr:RNA polymerase sigma factor [Deltaproteobacteria bacterium]